MTKVRDVILNVVKNLSHMRVPTFVGDPSANHLRMTGMDGQILPLVMIVVGLIMGSVLVMIGGSQLYFQNSTYSLNSEKATALAEAGLDKAVASLNKTGGNYNGETETILGDGSYSVTVTTKNSSTKLVQSTGYLPNKTNPKVKRTINIEASTGVGISFVYGLLVGDGGITMGNGAKINGSIYSNGNIVGGNNLTITGDAYVAGGTQPTADQQSDCSGVNCQDYIFGKSVSSENRQDVAQSFKPSSTAAINKVSLKLKKTGSPANATVYILSDNSGKPSKTVLASGTLSSNLVTGSYGFIDVSLTTSPSLVSGTSYWIMMHSAALNNSNYWTWSQDSAAGYNGGSPEWSQQWDANRPAWVVVSGDLAFKTWMGGVATSISMGNGSVVRGNVHANTISGFTINKDAYYQIISNATVIGTSHPGSTDPTPISMPISDANISDWKDGAASYGTISTGINGCPATLGPGKVSGDIILNNTCTVTVKTPIWVTGNVTTGNSSMFKMDDSLGASSGVIIVDGLTTFTNGNDLLGTGIAGSYLVLLSTSNSDEAVTTGNSSITGILYAPNGTITLANNATFKEAVANKIIMGTGTILTYDFGLINTFFSAGPGGSYSLVKGTYQVK